MRRCVADGEAAGGSAPRSPRLESEAGVDTESVSVAGGSEARDDRPSLAFALAVIASEEGIVPMTHVPQQHTPSSAISAASRCPAWQRGIPQSIAAQTTGSAIESRTATTSSTASRRSAREFSRDARILARL